MVKTETYQKNRYADFRQDLLQKIDFLQVYREFGVETVGAADSNGWISCRGHEALGGEDTNPSAGINVLTGVYKDFRIGDKAMSIFDFAVAIGKYQTWQEAQRAMAEKFEFKLIPISKSHPEHGVKWQAWSDNQARTYCVRKPPITIEGLKASGAKMCMRYDEPCFAWEIFDGSLNVIGYYFTSRSGQPFSGETTKGAKSIVKKFTGAEMGILGRPAAEYLASRPSEKKMIYWCEGGPDMVAAYSKWPESCQFITNPSGCQENVSDSVRKMLAGFRVCRIGDADVPGLSGAVKHAKQLTECEKVIVVTTHKNLEEKHGLDLRDYLSSDQLRDKSEIAEPEVLLELTPYDWEAKLQEVQSKTEQEQVLILQQVMDKSFSLLNSIGIEVLSREKNGVFTVDCSLTQQRLDFRKLSEISYNDMISLCGPIYTLKVAATEAKQEIESQPFLHSEVVQAIASQLSCIKPQGINQVGAGIWNVASETGGLQVGVISSKAFFTFNGPVIVKQTASKINKYAVDYSDDTSWFDADLMQPYLLLAQDTQWRIGVHNHLVDILSRWPWQSSNVPIVAAGLIYATWLQSIWSWRPVVSVIGESSAGKSILFKFMANIFLGSGKIFANSTTAGVMQTLRTQSLPLFLDEFDTTSQRRFLELFRGNSRGLTSVKGTPSHQAVQMQIKHIPWLAGIFTGASEQADRNRMIELSMLKRKTHIKEPTASESQELGRQILASVLYTAPDMFRTYNELKDIRVASGYLSREWESMAVSYSAMSAITGKDIQTTSLLLNESVEQYMTSQGPIISEQVDLLSQILSSPVPLDLPETTYSADHIPNRCRIMLSAAILHHDLVSYSNQLHRLGFAVVTYQNRPSLGMSPKIMSRNALELRLPPEDKDSKYTTILGRLKLVRTSQRFRIGDETVNGIIIPLDELRSWLELPMEDRN